MTRDLRLARWLALLVPLALFAGAWGAQLIGHLYPCEMCHWQRWPHYAAVVVALAAFAAPPTAIRRPIAIAALLIAVSGAIGVAHAGVEYHWWHGFTACSQQLDLSGLSAAERLARIMATPVIPCDIAQWRLFGVSLAGFNAVVSLAAAGYILFLLTRRVR